MGSPLLRPTHLTITAILLVAGLAGVTAGAATDDTEPIMWSMPAPVAGQYAAYTYSAYDADGEQIGDTRMLFELEVMRPSAVHDVDGHIVQTEGLAVTSWGYLPGDVDEGWSWGRGSTHVHWSTDDGVVVSDGVADLSFLRGGDASTDIAGQVVQSESKRADLGYRTFHRPAVLADNHTGLFPLESYTPCLATHPFGEVSAPVDGVRLRCDPGEIPTDPTLETLPVEEIRAGDYAQRGSFSLWLEPVGISDGDRRMLVAGSSGGFGDFRVWFPEDRPFAERLSWLDGDVEHVVAMAVWEERTPRGADWRAEEDLPLPEPAPLHLGMPDPRGVDQAFPAHEAWRIALQDDDVAAFMSSNPDARMSAVEYDRDTVAWTFRLPGVSGSDLEVTVAQSTASSTLTLLGQDMPQYDVKATQGPRHGGPGPGDVPDTALPVAEMHAVAEAFGLPLQEWSWSYEVLCLASRPGCDAPQVTLRIDNLESEEARDVDPETATVTSVEQERMHALIFNGSGRLEGAFLFDMETVSGTGLVDQDDAASPAPMAAPAPMPSAGRSYVAVAGSIGILAAVLYFFWPVAKNGLVGLFSRVRPDKALDHPTRQRIAEIIAAEPGIHGHGIARRMDMHRSTIDHHVRKLLDTEHIVAQKSGGYTCFYPKGTDRRRVAAAPALKSDTARSVLDFVAGHPGSTAGTVADAVGVTRSTASHHIHRLRDAGLVESKRDGQAVRLWVVAGMLA